MPVTTGRFRRLAALSATALVAATAACGGGSSHNGGNSQHGSSHQHGSSAVGLAGLIAADVAIGPGGRTAYVLGLDAHGGTSLAVVPVNLATGAAGSPIRLSGPANPGGVDGSIVVGSSGYAYIAHPGSSTIQTVNLATKALGPAIVLDSTQLGGSGGQICGLALAPNGATAYAAGCGAARSDTIVPINLSSNAPGHPISIDVSATSGSFTDIAIAPDGATAYVTDAESAARPENATLLPVDLATGQPGRPIRIAVGPVYEASIAIAPDGATGYVTSLVDSDSGQTVTVTPVALATGKPGTPIHIGDGGKPVFADNAYTLAIAPGGGTGYVLFVHGATETGTVVPVDLAAGRTGTPIQTGQHVQGAAVAIGRDGAGAYVTTTVSGRSYQSRLSVLPQASR